MTDIVTYVMTDGVAVITMDDGKANAMSLALQQAIHAALDQAERDADIPSDHVGPRPSGGVAGTRTGVKCLHAHYAWHLAGGDDPVGRWVAARLQDDA